MLTLERLAWLKHGAPPRNIWEAAIRAKVAGAACVEKTAGPADIVTVTDALKKPLVSCEIGIEPVQDLHGYEAPWPAGGWKNKIDFTTRSDKGITTTKTDGKAVITGTASGSIYPIDLVAISLPAGTYVWSISGLKTGISAAYTKNGSWAGNITQGATFTLAEAATIGGYARVESGTETNTTVAIMLESGSTASSWVPYENLCPISGWTGATLTRTGKNLWDNALYTSGENPLTLITDSSDTYYGYYGGSIASWSASRTVYLDADQITVTADYGADGGTFTFRVYFGYDDGTSDYNGGNITLTDGDKLTVTRTSASGKRCVSFSISTSAGAGNTRGRIKNVMVSVSGETQYADPVRTTCPVSWQDEAGTVYGGTVDLVSGVLTMTDAVVDLGKRTWNYIAPTTSIPYGTFYNTIHDKAFGQVNLVCDSYPIKAGFDNDFALQGNSGASTIYLQNSTFNGDTAALKASLNGVMLCYELATPQTYQLTPQQIQLLKGTNNLWADTGETEITYIAKKGGA